MILGGLFTRLAAFAMCIDLGVAIWKVHWPHGLMGEGGFEFPLALATIAFALIFFGGGPIALDHILRGGITWSEKETCGETGRLFSCKLHSTLCPLLDSQAKTRPR